MRYIISGIIILSVILGVGFWWYQSQRSLESKPKNVVITIWGLIEEPAVYKGVIDEYKKIKPEVIINYSRQSLTNYRTRVQTQVNEGSGPDIFMIHNSWLPMFLGENLLAAMPEGVMSLEEFSKIFYPVAKESFVSGGKIYGVPTGVDGLGLYYNEELLAAAGIGVPGTWPEFIDASFKATVLDEGGKIKIAGAAIGSVDNIEYWSDILGLLFRQQPQADLLDPSGQTSVEVLKFYTNFTLDPKKRIWEVAMEPAIQAFYSNRLVFYFGPSSKAREIKLASPQLKFKVAPVPQLPGGKVSWGSFWGYGAAERSVNQQEAFEFLKYLTSTSVQKQIYTESMRLNGIGQPFSRVDLAKELAEDIQMGAYVTQGPSYKSWYLSQQGLDSNGLNEEMIKVYSGVLKEVLLGGSPEVSLGKAKEQIGQIVSKYPNLWR